MADKRLSMMKYGTFIRSILLVGLVWAWTAQAGVKMAPFPENLDLSSVERMGGKLILSQEASDITVNQHVRGMRFLLGDANERVPVPAASR